MAAKRIFLKLFPEINLGDDLFLKIVLERYPQHNFLLNARKEYASLFADYANLEVFQNAETHSLYKLFYKGSQVIHRKVSPGTYPKSLSKSLRKLYLPIVDTCDGFLSVGGSIFIQNQLLPAYRDLELYKLMVENLTQTYFLGCNFGPFINSAFKEECTAIFKQSTDVCFREKYSQQLFESLENVRYAPDIVFGLKPKLPQKIAQSVGFTIITPRGLIDERGYVENYGKLIDHYLKSGQKVYLFSFCQKEGDEQIIEQIVSQLDTSFQRDNVIKYSGNISSFLDQYGAMEKMYCGRFHAMILSMLFNQKFYPLVYSDKMTNILKSVQFQGGYSKLADFGKINPTEMAQQLDACSYDISEAVAKSEDHFKILDRFLKP